MKYTQLSEDEINNLTIAQLQEIIDELRLRQNILLDWWKRGKDLPMSTFDD